MTTAAWITMGLICTIVWGGFLSLLSYALRREGQKSRSGSDPSGADGDGRR